jgi:hypothetical protein
MIGKGNLAVAGLTQVRQSAAPTSIRRSWDWRGTRLTRSRSGV